MPKHSYFRSGAFILLAAFQTGCTGLAALDSGNGPSLTLATTDHGQPGGDRFVQEREFGTLSAGVFASVMTVLADLGFRPTQADATSGFITASGSGRERIALEIGGLARSSDQTSVSVFIDRLSDDSTAVRVIFARSRTMSAKGESLQRTVREAEPYDTFFSALQAEIDRRNERLARRTSPMEEDPIEQGSVLVSEDPPPSTSGDIDPIAG